MIVTLVTALCLLRGLGVLGKPDMVYLGLGSLGVFGLALFVFGFFRQRGRR